MTNVPRLRWLTLGLGVLALAGCEDGRFDPDLRGLVGGPDTTDATRTATAPRPEPDARGVISYPDYKVAVARRGDTLADVAARIGVSAETLAGKNGIDVTTPLREGEIVALPGGVAGSAPSSGAIRPPGGVDIETLAGDAIDRAGPSGRAGDRGRSSAPAGRQPTRHKVAPGETAYSIARLYDVSVRALAEWNGLGPDLQVRPGQTLLIPISEEAREKAAAAPGSRETTPPGTNSPTAPPPSASEPLPEEDTAPASEPVEETPPSPGMAGDRTAASGTARLSLPVDGDIIRAFEKGESRGVDIAAAPGTPVGAAGDGTVALISRDTDQRPILVIRHNDDLLTVYANIADLAVSKGDSVSRGQKVAVVRDSDPSFVHLEVLEGAEPVDPMSYLN